MRGPLSPEIKAARYKARAVARFMDKVEQPTPGGCWIWRASLDRHGYGVFFYLGRKHGAHRVAYEFFRDEIPAGLHIDHLCRTPACVNPRHLEAVDQRTNTLRGNCPSALRFRANKCGKGHDMTPANTYIRPGNPRDRRCRICISERRKAA